MRNARGPVATMRRGGGILAAALATVGGLAIALAPSALAAPRLTISDSTVHAGQVVTVTGSGFPSGPTSLYITICANPPGATNCDVDLAHVTQVQYDGSGGFRTRYKVAVTRFASAAGTIDCTKAQCVIGSTNALDPKDRSYNAVALFTVASGSAGSPSPKPSKSKPPKANPSETTTAATGTDALPRTGATSTTSWVAAVGVTAVLAGALVMVGTTRRRGNHAR